MRTADLCYTEANLLDNRHPDVWANIAVLAAHLNRFEEAEQVCGGSTKCVSSLVGN